MGKILYTESLTKEYGKKRIIDSISMNIKEGEIYGFVGKNGAGKSTTMRMLCGLAYPTSGKIIMDSKLLPSYSKIGALIESPGLYYNMTAIDNLSYKAIMLGCNTKDELKEILKSVGLDSNLKTKVKDFSLGMKQRLGIAIALVGSPNLMILDEPINGLDPQGIAEVRDVLLDLNKKGITIMISSHILTELYKVATNYGFISRGKLLLEITKDNLDKKCSGKCLLTVNNVDKAKMILSDFDIEHSNNNDSIILNNVDNRSDAINLLVKNGINILNISIEETSLEDFYFDICKE
ncbi:ATP-binding cassette domain-containing protein [Ruminococcus sp.]|uniref:ATP-binding cassette domain-containing protein n=1 Tax=Ruminococcus sp. TaxID=41978 RepID=UPI0025F788D9|nr:ATP-binding cassette domain-containing protein [Ruminococcus sp.]MBQ8964967.1 ATP-binding cassette domain-containing protein [Ruminococcus sp.]